MPKELTQAEQDAKEQGEGIAEMVKALSIGPTEKKDEKDEKKPKKKSESDDEKEDGDDKEESDDEDSDEEDEEDTEDEEENIEEEGADDDEGDTEEEEDEDDEDSDEDEEDSDDDDDEDEEDEEDEDEDDIKLQLEVLKAQNKLLKEGKDTTDDEIKKQLGVTNIKDLEDIDFVGEVDDEDEIVITKEGLNKHLNSVRTKTMQEMMVILPGMAATLVAQRTNMDKAVEKFYEDNEDFVPHKDYVGLVAQQVQSKNPGLTYETMFKLVAKTVRKNLNLKKKVEKVRSKEEDNKKKSKRTDKSNPALNKKGAGGGGTGRGKKDTRTTKQKEMDSMIDAVG